MLPIVATAPATANDRRDKWVDLLFLGIVVLPVSSMVVPPDYESSNFPEAKS
jgi:hypothetical protein